MNESIVSELNHVLKLIERTSGVVPWIRIHLAMQGTRVQSLGREGLACHAAAAPGAPVTEVRLPRAAHGPAEPGGAAPEAHAPGARALQQETLRDEKPAPRSWRAAPALSSWRNARTQPRRRSTVKKVPIQVDFRCCSNFSSYIYNHLYITLLSS